MASIWLREEVKADERRTPLSPDTALKLIEYGHQVVIEKSMKRIFTNAEYAVNGCKLVASGSWVEASEDTLVLGLKYLPNDDFPLIHKHCYFAHAYNRNRVFVEKIGVRNLMKRFIEGCGTHFDLEFLEDENCNRIAAFGHHAGLAGAIIGMFVWNNITQGNPNELLPKDLSSVQDANQRIKYLNLDRHFRQLNILVLGYKGRCSSGVRSFLDGYNIKYTCWGRIETSSVKNLQEIDNFDIIFNCIRADETTPTIIEIEQFQNRLSPTLIVDIGCETSSNNPIKIYQETTTFDNPIYTVRSKLSNINIIAIDNLPSYLPLESSKCFSQQLSQHFLAYLEGRVTTPWQKAQSTFEQALSRLKYANHKYRF
jgi:saccharopine dehydrogenase (NAD+, L-lysine-forming)